MLEKVKNLLREVVFYVSAISVLVLAYLLGRKKDENASLKEQLVRERIGQELKDLTDKADKSDADYDAARSSYLKLKSKYPEYFK